MTTMEGLRRQYHQQLCDQIFSMDADGAPNNADKYSALSIALAKRILLQIGLPVSQVRQSGQTSFSPSRTTAMAWSLTLEKGLKSLSSMSILLHWLRLFSPTRNCGHRWVIT